MVAKHCSKNESERTATGLYEIAFIVQTLKRTEFAYPDNPAYLQLHIPLSEVFRLDTEFQTQR